MSAYKMIFMIRSFVFLTNVFYFSSGLTLNRIGAEVEDSAKCEELDKPSWSIDSLRNVTLDEWPWRCLNSRYNSTLGDLVSNRSSDIFHAASNGSLGYVQYYAEKANVSLNSFNEDSQTPLHLAVKNGRLDVVKYLATRVPRTDLNVPDREHRTPLAYAALFGQPDIAKYLLNEASADSSYDEDDKNNLLRMAAKGGNRVLLKYLLDDRGYTLRRDDQQLLLSAAAGGDVRLIMYLIYGKGLTKTGTNRRGDTALHVTASEGRLEAAQFFLVTLRYHVNVRNAEEATPAHLAVEGGSLAVLRYLIERKGADLNARNGYGDSLLHVAAHHGRLAIVEYLVDRVGMSVELKDYTSRTPLHRAVRRGHLDVARYLAAVQHADLSGKDKDGRNVLHQAVLSGSVDVVKYLVNEMDASDRINEVDPLLHRTAALEAANLGRLTILKLLIDQKNAKLWMVDSEGKNLLHTAARGGHLAMVKYLIEERSFDVNAESPDRLNAYDFATMFEGDAKELLEYLYKRMNPDLVDEES